MKFEVEEGYHASHELPTPDLHSSVHVNIMNKTYNAVMQLMHCDFEIFFLTSMNFLS